MSQHNKELKNQLNGLNKTVGALKKHNETVYQAEVRKLTNEINALKEERRAAIELADVKKVDALDQQIEDIKENINTAKPEDTQETETDNPVFDDWIKDNQWYLTDKDMANYAETVAEQYVGAPLDRVYKIVREKVKEVFPEKFTDNKQTTTSKQTTQEKQQEQEKETPKGPKSPVESSSAKGNEGTFTKADLSPDQIQIMKQFVGSGIMTEEQYIADIAKMQGE